MKKVFFIFGCLSVLIFFSCNKTSNQVSENKPLVGKWILVETLADPGDGSGKWTAVDKQNYYYLQVNANSTIKSNIFTGWGGLEKYKIMNDSVVNFIYANGSKIIQYYKDDNSSLTLTGGCIEACGSKFIKVRQ